MSAESANIVVCAVVSWRLDYCNTLGAGVSEASLDNLQRALGSSAYSSNIIICYYTTPAGNLPQYKTYIQGRDVNIQTETCQPPTLHSSAVVLARAL